MDLIFTTWLKTILERSRPDFRDRYWGNVTAIEFLPKWIRAIAVIKTIKIEELKSPVKVWLLSCSFTLLMPPSGIKNIGKIEIIIIPAERKKSEPS